MKEKISDRVFNCANVILCGLIAFATIYPLVYVISMSLSSPSAVVANQVTFLPRGFSLKAYGIVMRNREIWVSYGNTIFYTVASTLISVTLTMLAAYPLSRRDFCLRKFLNVFFSITLFFTGTLIPMFLLINRLGLYNTRWAIILPTGATAYYIMMARTFLEGIPDSLYESARMDGAGEFTILGRIYLPLSVPVIAVLSLYYAVTMWNSYFEAMIYLTDKSLQPLQVYLMNVLTQNSQINTAGGMSAAEMGSISLQLQYVVIVVAILPILVIYPFIQKYFTKGALVGAVKG